MKKMLFTIFLFILSVHCLAVPAKWTKQENWRKIKDDMPEAAVIKLVGKPTFERTDSGGKTYYFVTKEPDWEKAKENNQYNTDAYIEFSRNPKNRRIFIVSGFIKEPDFSKIKDIQAEKPKKLKPKKKLEKWQIQKNWSKIKAGMGEKTLIAILGEPTKKNLLGDFEYGARDTGGKVEVRQTVGDNNNTVESWREPFWYRLNKELFEEVKPKNSKKGRQKSMCEIPKKSIFNDYPAVTLKEFPKEYLYYNALHIDLIALAGSIETLKESTNLETPQSKKEDITARLKYSEKLIEDLEKIEANGEYCDSQIKAYKEFLNNYLTDGPSDTAPTEFNIIKHVKEIKRILTELGKTVVWGIEQYNCPVALKAMELSMELSDLLATAKQHAEIGLAMIRQETLITNSKIVLTMKIEKICERILKLSYNTEAKMVLNGKLEGVK